MRINIYRGQIDAAADRDNAYIALSSASTVPDSIDKVPDSASAVPDSIDKVPDSAGAVPDSIDKMPDNEQERQIYQHVLEHGFITTVRAAELLKVKQRRARAVLQGMVEGNYLRKEGAARSTIYVNNIEGR